MVTRTRRAWQDHPNWAVAGVIGTLLSVLIGLVALKPVLWPDRDGASGTHPPATGSTTTPGAGPRTPPATRPATAPPAGMVTPAIPVPPHASGWAAPPGRRAGRSGPYPAPSAQHTRTAQNQVTASLVAQKGSFIDFDTAPPTTRGAASSPDDVLIGPDNAYSEHARIWPDAGTDGCAAQALSNGNQGFQEKMDLHQPLRTAPDSVVRACLVTTAGRVLTLAISAENGNAWAPYRIRYTR